MIHPTAIVHSDACLDTDVSVGAYSLIGAQVKIASGTRIGPHVVIEGDTTIGRDNQIFQFCSGRCAQGFIGRCFMAGSTPGVI